MMRSRTSTAPTYLRGHVERVATTCAMLMKYSSHDARGRISSAMRHGTARGGSQMLWSASDVGWGCEEQVQGHGDPPGDAVPDARRSREARAGDPRDVGRDAA